MAKLDIGFRAYGERHEQTQFTSVTHALKVLEPDAPLHLFNPVALKSQARMFLNVFGAGASYAVKANPSPAVIATLVDAGMSCFDIASIAEAALVKQIAPFARLHYHNPIRTKGETVDAITRCNCKRFAVDDLVQLEKLAICAPEPSEIEVAIRFKLPFHGRSVHDFSYKFGACPDEAAVLLERAQELGFKVAVTFHPGSQCEEVEMWIDHLRAAHDIISRAGVSPVAVNIGGGFAIRYAHGRNQTGSEHLTRISSAFSALFDRKHVRLECEPGRALCGPAYQIATRVKAVRRGYNAVFLNDGLYGSLMETAQAPALRPAHTVFRGSNEVCGPFADFDVYGPTCDPLDRLPDALRLPSEIAEGDYIVFANAGAYSRATTTRFNGYDCGDEVEVASW